MTAAEMYAALRDAVDAQQVRIYGKSPPVDPWGGPAAQLFRSDPHRKPEANLEVIASYVELDDVVIDVGGGAGRICLPLALRCREAIAVDPSPGMGIEFEASRTEAGITNARRVQANWLEAQDITSDVVFSADVTYFVRDIVPFIQKLIAAAKHRVMITLWSVSPPDRHATLFRLVYGETQAPVPGFQQLLSVLWEMGILPDVRVLPDPPWWEQETLLTREEAVQLASQGRWLRPEDQARARVLVEQHFDELFFTDPAGYRPLWQQRSREVLITWETNRRL